MPAYASGINLNLSLDELGKQVERWLDRGYTAVKIKVGRPLAEDSERVALTRELIGVDRLLMVDANQGWDIPSAERAIAALTPYQLHWVEEPLLADDIHAHALVRSRTRVPIAIGENVYTRYQFLDYIRSDACDFVQADVVRVGGITPFLEIATLVDAHGLQLAPHFMSELTGQLLCCTNSNAILEDVEGGSLTELGALTHDISVSDGRYRPPDRPGHGIVFDQQALEPYLLVDAVGRVFSESAHLGES